MEELIVLVVVLVLCAVIAWPGIQRGRPWR
jgi:hypothetical protein